MWLTFSQNWTVDCLHDVMCKANKICTRPQLFTLRFVLRMPPSSVSAACAFVQA